MKNKETLEEFAERISKGNGSDNSEEIMEGIIEGAKWQQERMYSEDEVIGIIKLFTRMLKLKTNSVIPLEKIFNEWFERIKKK